MLRFGSERVLHKKMLFIFEMFCTGIRSKFTAKLIATSSNSNITQTQIPYVHDQHRDSIEYFVRLFEVLKTLSSQLNSQKYQDIYAKKYQDTMLKKLSYGSEFLHMTSEWLEGMFEGVR